jgi:hypothetical protein
VLLPHPGSGSRRASCVFSLSSGSVAISRVWLGAWYPILSCVVPTWSTLHMPAIRTLDLGQTVAGSAACRSCQGGTAVCLEHPSAGSVGLGPSFLPRIWQPFCQSDTCAKHRLGLHKSRESRLTSPENTAEKSIAAPPKMKVYEQLKISFTCFQWFRIADDVLPISR